MDIKRLQKRLGVRLRELRNAKGLKQEDLEKEWDLSYRYYGKLERGHVNPTLKSLARISEIYQVSLCELFRFLDEKGGDSEDAQALALEVGRILSGKNKDKIRKLRVFLKEIL